MNTGSYSLAAPGEADLAEIWLYFAQFDPENANRFVGELIDIFEMLARNPLAGSSRSHIRENLRCFPKDNYGVFYYPRSTSVKILRILHFARDIETILDTELPQ